MKVKTTRKGIVNSTPAKALKCAGYCELQALLRNHEPVAYTSGIYGWNFDVYEVYGLTICTGYRNMPGSQLESCGEYEKKRVLFGATTIIIRARTVTRDKNRWLRLYYRNFAKLTAGSKCRLMGGTPP